MDTLISFMDAGPFVAAFLIGLLGGAHCIGMCGGVMAALSFSVGEQSATQRLTLLMSYNVGRISSYVLIGVLAGILGSQLSDGAGLSIMRVIAGLLLLAMGLYVAGWWQGLTYLERIGNVLWRHLQPLSRQLMPVKTTGAALLLGMVWGWLPCGLIYTALVYAMAQADVISSAGVMLAFGLGTLPALLVAGVAAERMKALIQKRGFRSVMGAMIILFGCWTIWGTYQHAGHANHGAMDHAQMNHEDMDHAQMNHEGMDHAQMNHEDMDHAQMNHEGMDHAQMNHEDMDHTQMNHESMDHSQMQH